jgi:hypothetical protein
VTNSLRVRLPSPSTSRLLKTSRALHSREYPNYNNVPVVYDGGRNAFDADKSILRASGRGGP